MFEYKVVPAPVRGVKAKGVKTHEDRFAHALALAMNEQAADGWEYLRADTLPCEQRDGLMSKTTAYQNMLVFRRAKAAPANPTPAPAARVPSPKPAPVKPAVAAPEAPKAPTPPEPPVAKKPEAQAD